MTRPSILVTRMVPDTPSASGMRRGARTGASSWLAGGALGVLTIALSLVGCAPSENPPGDTATIKAALEAEPPPPQLAKVRIFAKAPAFKRATQAEVEAFQARMNGGIAPRQRTTAELDAILADVSSTDPVRKQSALRQYHDAIRAIPSTESRRLAGERLQAVLAAR